MAKAKQPQLVDFRTVVVGAPPGVQDVSAMQRNLQDTLVALLAYVKALEARVTALGG